MWCTNTTALQQLRDFLTSRVGHYTDNRGVSRNFEIGSPNVELQKMAEDVFDHCKELNITLDIHWLSRETS